MPDARASAAPLAYLHFELSESGAGVNTLEAMATTAAHRLEAAAAVAAVMAEVAQVLDWAQQHFPNTQGPLDDGHDWQHELQTHSDDAGWHQVTLTLSASDAFVAEFRQAFGAALA